MTIRLARSIAVTAVLIGAAPCGVGRAAEATANWRWEVNRTIPYAPPAGAVKAKPALPPWLLALPDRPIDPDAVEMQPVVVRSKPIYGELTTAFVQQKTAAKNAAIADKLGIGFEGYHNRNFAVGFVTVFHVPVMVIGGLSW